MIERRRTPRRHWTIGRNDQGQATLEWSVDPRDISRLTEEDPFERTYDFLQKLDVPDLTLEDGPAGKPVTEGWDPYDTGVRKIGNAFRGAPAKRR